MTKCFRNASIGVSRSSLRRATLAVVCLAFSARGVTQTELAQVTGRVTDQSGAAIVDAEVQIKNVDTNLSFTVKTNQDGFYTFLSLRPSRYVLLAQKAGFKTLTVTQFVLNAQDRMTRDLVLQVGSENESVTVTAETLNINTTDATVSTVVDREFADNLPLNGRSIQSLIELTPGVLPTGGEGNTDASPLSEDLR
jgi:Carboxypeptidase regulatory-like domain